MMEMPARVYLLLGVVNGSAQAWTELLNRLDGLAV